MLKLATTFDNLKWKGLSDAPVRSVTELRKALNVESQKIGGTKWFSLRDVMSASWEKVTFTNDGLKLVGYLFKPLGSGPFPAVIWNHGSEKLGREGQDGDKLTDELNRVADEEAANKSAARSFGNIASVLVPAGYVVFAPVRRGQGASEGDNISKLVDDERNANGSLLAGILSMQLQEGPHLSDQLAGLSFLKSLPYVDKHKLAVFGCSFGGIQTLLGAESGEGYKAAIAMSPGAETWRREVVQLRLLRAVENIDKAIPVLLIHPKRDDTVEPGYTLGQKFEELGKPYGLIIFPPYGKDSQQEHCFGSMGDSDSNYIWAPPVLEFLKWAFERSPA